MARTHGERRRREILAAAIDLGSAEGLAGLSIARLADEIGMSKSGLFAHFGSKQELQLATIGMASQGYERQVLAPAQDAEPGLARLRALMSAWIDYIEGSAYRGGCFFDSASSEFSSRPGPVRDQLARLSRAWLRRLEQEARAAVRMGELEPDVDPARLAFVLHAYVGEANWARELLGDEQSFSKARAAVADALQTPEEGKAP